jgi:uncharacterized Zn finger protein
VSSLVGSDLARLGRDHLEQGRVFDVEPDDGGVLASVLGPGGKDLEVWVGVVNGQLTAECDCGAEAQSFCAHAVAVTYAAIEDGIDFVSSAAPREDDEDEQRFAEVAAGLSHEQLVDLVVRQAVADPDFADELLNLVED